MATLIYLCNLIIRNMRVIAKSTLKEFYIKHPDSEEQLTEWYSIVSKSKWKNPKEVKQVFPSADYVENNRMVFNIRHNKYRLIVALRYNIQMVFIRFIGTHKEYNKINDIKNI